jgi:hypothetical protein
MIISVGLSKNKGGPRHCQPSFCQRLALTPLFHLCSHCRSASEAKQVQMSGLLGAMAREVLVEFRRALLWEVYIRAKVDVL